MLDIDDLVAEINAEQREFEQTIWLPASPDAIVRLRRLAWDGLGTDLPEDYGFQRPCDLWRNRAQRSRWLSSSARNIAPLLPCWACVRWNLTSSGI
jgi:hypothetical protein